MIRRRQVEADVIRLIVTTREKFPHTVEWDAALKRVIWRYSQPPQAKRKRRRKRPPISDRRSPTNDNM